jgi:hypothetical protein
VFYIYRSFYCLTYVNFMWCKILFQVPNSNKLPCYIAMHPGIHISINMKFLSGFYSRNIVLLR